MRTSCAALLVRYFVRLLITGQDAGEGAGVRSGSDLAAQEKPHAVLDRLAHLRVRLRVAGGQEAERGEQSFESCGGGATPAVAGIAAGDPRVADLMLLFAQHVLANLPRMCQHRITRHGQRIVWLELHHPFGRQQEPLVGKRGLSGRSAPRNTVQRFGGRPQPLGAGSCAYSMSSASAASPG